MAFTGDIMLSRGVGEVIEKSPTSNILDKSIINLFEEMDYVVGNMECPISDDATQINKTSFKATPESLKQVKGFDLFSLANNHIFDCGKSGSSDTINNLINSGNDVTGLLTAKDDNYFFNISISGKSFGFFSCATQECIKDKRQETFPKIINAEDNELFEQLKIAKSKLDYVVILIHGSDEMIPYPEPTFRKICESYIDNGADLVFSHHPHVLGGVHHYKDKFIFYSLGDFIFDGESTIRRRGAIVKLLIHGNKLIYSLIPTQINNDLTVTLANENNKRKIIKKWNRISKVLQTDTQYSKKYKYRYIYNLAVFQLDRVSFLIKNKGVVYLLKFASSRLKLLPYYMKKIIK